ncbi:uncharacterized protein [Diadema setosum]|uniref:uncharacterized protein n=1 Tax=Diadema setosum TaxID=31175 RepID=UPI003B3BC52A
MAKLHPPDDQLNAKLNTAPELSASLFLAEIVVDALKLLPEVVESNGVHEVQSQGSQSVDTSSGSKVAKDSDTPMICSSTIIPVAHTNNFCRTICDEISSRNVKFDSELVHANIAEEDYGSSNNCPVVPADERYVKMICNNAANEDDFVDGGKLLPRCLSKKADLSVKHEYKSIPDDTVLCECDTQQVLAADGLSEVDGNLLLLEKNGNGGLSTPLLSLESSAKKTTPVSHDLVMRDCEAVLNNIVTVIATQTDCVCDEFSTRATHHEEVTGDQTDEIMDLNPASGKIEDISSEVGHHFAEQSTSFPGEEEGSKSTSTEDNEEVSQSGTISDGLNSTLNLAVERYEPSSKRARLSSRLDGNDNLPDIHVHPDCTSELSTADVEKDITVTNQDGSFTCDKGGKSDDAYSSLDVSLFDEFVCSSTEPMQTLFSTITTHPPFNSISSIPGDEEIYTHSTIHSDECTVHVVPAVKEPLHGCGNSGQETFEGSLSAAKVVEYSSVGSDNGRENDAKLFQHKTNVSHTSSYKALKAQDQPMQNEIAVELEIDKQDRDVPGGRSLPGSSVFVPDRATKAEEMTLQEDQTLTTDNATGEEAQIIQSDADDELSRCKTEASSVSYDTRLAPEDQSSQRDDVTKFDGELKKMDMSEVKYLPVSSVFVPYSSGVVEETSSLEERSLATDTPCSAGSGMIAPVSDDQEVPTSELLLPSDQSVDRLLESEESIYPEQAQALIKKCNTEEEDCSVQGPGNEDAEPTKGTIPDHLQTVGQPLSGVFLWSRTLHPETGDCSPSDSAGQTVLTPVRPLPPCPRKTRRVGLSRRQLVFPLHAKKLSQK